MARNDWSLSIEVPQPDDAVGTGPANGCKYENDDGTGRGKAGGVGVAAAANFGTKGFAPADSSRGGSVN